MDLQTDKAKQWDLNDCRKHRSTFVGYELVLHLKKLDLIPSSLCSNDCTKANGSVSRNGEVSRFRGFEGLSIEQGRLSIFQDPYMDKCKVKGLKRKTWEAKERSHLMLRFRLFFCQITKLYEKQ